METATVVTPVQDPTDSATPTPKLTARQQSILNFLQRYLQDRGFPPSIREIGDAVGLSSPSSVAHQLKVLQHKGYLHRDQNRPRAVELRRPGRSGTTESPPTRPMTNTPRPFLCSGESPPGVRSWPRNRWRKSSPCPVDWSVRAVCSCSPWSVIR